MRLAYRRGFIASRPTLGFPSCLPFPEHETSFLRLPGMSADRIWQHKHLRASPGFPPGNQKHPRYCRRPP
jgi:hypothetical protein